MGAVVLARFVFGPLDNPLGLQQHTSCGLGGESSGLSATCARATSVSFAGCSSFVAPTHGMPGRPGGWRFRSW